MGLSILAPSCPALGLCLSDPSRWIALHVLASHHPWRFIGWDSIQRDGVEPAGVQPNEYTTRFLKFGRFLFFRPLIF